MAPELVDEDEDLAELLGLPERLPPVRLAPEEELVASARASELLRRLKTLAEWVGEDRPLTEEGDLPPSDAAEVAGLLDMAASGPVEELADVPELVHLWELALAIDVVVVDDDGRASADTDFLPAAEDSEDSDDAEDSDGFDDLATWMFAFAETLGSLELDADLAGEETLRFEGSGALALMLFLARDEGVTRAELSEITREGAVEDLPADEAEDAWAAWVAAHGDPATVLLARLGEHGAVKLDGETARLTPLGTWAMREQLRAGGIEVPELPARADMTAADLVAASDGLAEEELAEETEAWLAGRTAEEAAGELLTAAAAASPSGRVFATSTTVHLGEAAEPSWRAALAEPEVRPYALLALEQLTGEPAEPTAEEVAWLLLDQLTAAVDFYGQYDPEQLGEQAAATLPAGRELEVLEVAWRLPHPNAKGALELLGAHHPDKKVAKAARTAAFKRA